MVLTAALTKQIKSLQLAKFRKEFGQFVMEGDKLVREALNQQALKRTGVFATEAWKSSVSKQFDQKALAEIKVVTEPQLKAMSSMQTPQQTLATLQIPADHQAALAARAIYLDDIQDPGNVGTILRLADWFGITQVYASEATADFYNPKVVQASMGAVLRLHLKKCPLGLLAQPDTRIVAADMHGHSVYDWDIPQRMVLLLGNEGNGVNVSHAALIQDRVTITRPRGGGAESLNVASAAAILLSEWSKAV
jgi:TrmH family RNA methyltransferase